MCIARNGEIDDSSNFSLVEPRFQSVYYVFKVRVLKPNSQLLFKSNAGIAQSSKNCAQLAKVLGLVIACY